MMSRIALYHLETLLWIARLGTFSAAAERLNTSQPAVSARVREIELQLGVRLFRRNGRRMEFTPQGRRLVSQCEPLWAAFERTLLEVSDFAGAAGVVKIGSGEIAASSCLPGFLQSVERDLPGVSVEVELDLTSRMLQQLLSGTSDMVFLAGPVASPGVRTCAIGAVDLVWAANRTTAAAMARRHPVPVWSLPSHSPLHGAMLESLQAQAVPHRSINTCNNVRTLTDIVAGGRGAALLPETMIRGHLADGTLREVLPRPERRVQFEVAIRSRERDPLILELFRRAGMLSLSGAVPVLLDPDPVQATIDVPSQQDNAAG